MAHLDHRTTHERVAVVGLACRFPGARDAREFWRNLLHGTDSVTEVPAERFDAAAVFAPRPGTAGHTVSRHGGFIDDVFEFDAGFFGIAPSEARAVDPQQRVLLHVVWEALADAGIRPSSLAGSRTGVFIGQATADYADAARPLGRADLSEAVGSRIRAFTAGRVSFALDVRGPSLVVDTACSSSLVAVHLARQSLESGESEQAIVGGVNLILSPRDAVAYSQAAMLAPDGRCKFADVRADGFVRSEGVGVLILKRLSDALRDGDRVQAVLPGSAVTNDGAGSGLLIKPAVSGQLEMLRAAWRSAGITPDELGYVEAHGTGTPVGDTVELTSLLEACAGRAAGHPVRVGSVKSNIGHCEAAAGIAGLVKAVLIAGHGVVPPSLHVETEHAALAEPGAPVRVVTGAEPLGEPGRDVMGVSSFGLSGTNAHVVVAPYHAPEGQDAARPARRDDDPRPQLLVLSAKSEASLRALARRHADHLRPGGDGHTRPLDEMCAAAALTRDHHPFRCWALGTTHLEIADRLDDLANGREHPDAGTAEPRFGPAPRVMFVFPGQGSQWPGMGGGLTAAFPAFAEAMRECDEAIRAELGWSVSALLCHPQDPFPEEVDVVQPALWAMEVALAALWRDLGVEPDACLGHSMGECAAAVVSGALTVRDAAAVICRRSRLMRRQTGLGAMLATDLTADEADRLVAGLGEKVCVAAWNSPRSTVLAGDPGLLGGVAQDLEASGGLGRFVRVGVASHSPDMDPLRAELLAVLESIGPRSGSRPLFSTVRAAPIEGAELDNRYWADNLRQPVRFAQTVRAAVEQASYTFLEVSPHPLLTQAVEDCLDEAHAPIRAVPSLRRHCAAAVELTRAAGRLYAGGADVDWARWHRRTAAERGSWRATLPGYPWDTVHLRDDAPPELPGAHLVFEQPLDARAFAVSGPHGPGLPPMLHADAVFDAVRDLLPGRLRLTDVELAAEPLEPELEDGAVVRVELSARGEGYAAAVHLRRPGGRTGAPTRPRLTALVVPAETDDHVVEPLDQVLARCADYVSAELFEAEVAERGYSFPAAYRGVERLWRRRGQAVAGIRLSDPMAPAALEVLLRPLFAALPGRGRAARDAYLPLSVEAIEVGANTAELSGRLWSVVTVHEAPERSEELTADVIVYGEGGTGTVARILGIRLLRFAGPAADEARRPGNVRVPARRPGHRDSAAPPAIPSQRGPAGPPPAQDTAPDTARDLLVRHAAALLGVSPERLDPRRTLHDLGFDSIMAVRLRNRLRTDADIDLATGRILGRETIGGLLESL